MVAAAAVKDRAGLGAGSRAPALALTLAAFFWSGNFIAGRALHEHIDPLTLNFARWLTALALLAPFVWRDVRASLPILLREWRLVVGLGTTGIAAFHTMAYVALQTTSATNALLTLSLVPIAILAGAALIGAERPTARQLMGALVSIVGAVVLITNGDLTALRTASFNAGHLWMLAAVAVWAIYSLLLRRRPADLPQGAALAASIAAGLALLAPPLFVTARTPLAAFASIPIALSIGYISVFASVIAFRLWSYGVSQLGAARSGQFIHLMPVFGAALASGVLGETPTLSQLGGGALVLAGIVAVERRPEIRFARARSLSSARRM
jgi:drug/metabolite transporter (DMT)-like permease